MHSFGKSIVAVHTLVPDLLVLQLLCACACACVCVCVRVRKDVHMFFHSFCVSVCNVSRTPGSVAGARLIAASQLAHDVSQPGSK